VALRRRGRWVAAVSVGAVVALVTGAVTAGPAFAHTEIEIAPARALAANAVMSVHAEAESTTAGVTSLRVFPPSGIAPTDVSAVKAPKGWTLTVQPDSFTVAGPKLPVGTAATFQVRIRQLPNARSVTFKVLQTYSDGRVDRWIGDPSADNPAPVVKLAAAAPGATALAPTTPAAPTTGAGAAPVTTAPATTAPATTAPAQPTQTPVASEDRDSGQTWPWVVLAVVVLAAAGGGWVWFARRRRAS
jgi:uncharacterized protein YcnI